MTYFFYVSSYCGSGTVQSTDAMLRVDFKRRNAEMKAGRSTETNASKHTLGSQTVIAFFAVVVG